MAPKSGRADDECEDAAQAAMLRAPWPEQELEIPVRVAIADGATESLLGGQWAGLLCHHFCADPVGAGLSDALAAARRGWPQHLVDFRRRHGEDGLSWLEEGALARGTFATVVGMELVEGSVRAWAVGDSCLLVRRGPRLRASFPVTSAQELSSFPDLVRAEGAIDLSDLPTLNTWEGRVEAGDVLYLVTDAVAGWALATREAGEDPLGALDRSVDGGRAGMSAWLERERRDGRMKDDDSTIVRVAVH
ncbi:hypothetical protein [Aquihabitans sp. McL0605]|uniref:hypothetical protein n=1 Tax=Aquihabitans sp. McL0605 TaxID=3415671 RepID=UPI003CEB839F